MKPETKPTSEEKQRFFAQYWMQPVMTVYQKQSEILKEKFVAGAYMADLTGCVLELKPLSSITDEDAIEVAKIIYPVEDENKGEFQIEINKRRKECHTSKEGLFEVEEMELTNSFELKIADYLRSKGYLLPWNGYTVDQLISFGWVQIKEV